MIDDEEEAVAFVADREPEIVDKIGDVLCSVQIQNRRLMILEYRIQDVTMRRGSESNQTQVLKKAR
jgi:hypothetical protein